MRRATGFSILLLLAAVLFAATPWEVLGASAVAAPAGAITGTDIPGTGTDEGAGGCCTCLCFATSSPVLVATALSALPSGLGAGSSVTRAASDAVPTSPLRLVFRPPRLA